MTETTEAEHCHLCAADYGNGFRHLYGYYPGGQFCPDCQQRPIADLLDIGDAEAGYAEAEAEVQIRLASGED